MRSECLGTSGLVTDLTRLERFWMGSVSAMMTQAGHSRVTPDRWGWLPYL